MTMSMKTWTVSPLFSDTVHAPAFLVLIFDLIMLPNCCKYFVNSRTPNRKNSRPATPANTATGIFAALIRLMKSELTKIDLVVLQNGDKGYIDVGDECWRQFMLMTSLDCC